MGLPSGGSPHWELIRGVGWSRLEMYSLRSVWGCRESRACVCLLGAGEALVPREVQQRREQRVALTWMTLCASTSRSHLSSLLSGSQRASKRGRGGRHRAPPPMGRGRCEKEPLGTPEPRPDHATRSCHRWKSIHSGSMPLTLREHRPRGQGQGQGQDSEPRPTDGSLIFVPKVTLCAVTSRRTREFAFPEACD